MSEEEAKELIAGLYKTDDPDTVQNLSLIHILLRIAAVAAVLLSIWLYLSGAMTLFTCLMMAIAAFLVYSELESAGEMFVMLPMMDASIDRVEQIDHAPRMDEQGTKQETKNRCVSETAPCSESG